MGEQGTPQAAALSRSTVLFVLLAVVAGIALRLSYPTDIEFKADERWTFDQVRAAMAGGPWQWTGMPLSIGGLNPGMSLWVFIGLGWVAGAETPPDLARAVQLLNCAALVALVLFAWGCVHATESEAWYWAAALWAVNPLAVILERKIWPPSVLPLFIVVMIAAWWHRRHALGSFVFALLAALLTQIHLSVALLTAAMAIWSLAEDRRSLRWGPLLAGAVLGALPALPWLIDWVQTQQPARAWRLPLLHFWLRWLTQPFGFGADYTLGVAHFREFLSGPVVAGTPTYLVAVLHAVIALLAIASYLRAALALWTRKAWSIRTTLLGEDATGLLLRAALIGFGALLTVLTMRGAGAHRHYLVIVAPLMALWVARLAVMGDGGAPQRRGRSILAGLCIASALTSLSLLHYIHVTQIIDGEFGATWSAQQPGRAPPAPTLVIPPPP